MKAIVSTVMRQEEAIDRMTSAYIESISVNEDVVPTTRIREHLPRFGLECNDPQQLEDSPRVLGLTVGMELRWKRRSIIPEVPDIVTWWTVFSLRGRILGHFPLCEWFCVACGIINKRASLDTKSWDDYVRDPLSSVCCSRQWVQWSGWSLSWGLVRRQPGAEGVSRSQFSRNRSSVGETRVNAGGRLLAATCKRRPTYKFSGTGRHAERHQRVSPVTGQVATQEDGLYVSNTGYWTPWPRSHECVPRQQARRWLGTFKEPVKERESTLDVTLVTSS